MSGRRRQDHEFSTCKLNVYITTGTATSREVTVIASCSRESLPAIPSRPHQPTAFSFPKRSFGKKKVTFRSFQASWFRQWPYLHYDEARDLAFCHTCVMAFKEKRVKAQMQIQPL